MTQAAQPEPANVDAYIEAQMRSLGIPGLALGIVQDERAVYMQGYGTADPTGRPVTPDTPFRIASVSKPLTALAVMQLVERGVLGLDDPVQRYLPWFTLADTQAASRVTVRDLLYHTSGIPPYAGYDNLFNGDLSDTALTENVSQLSRVEPLNDGSAYQYANLNYDTLGLLVEVASGQSYEAYMQQHVFGPLGMTNSYVTQADARQNGMATGYRQWFGVPVPADLPDDRAARPSSFLISSAADLTHWLVAELNDGRYGESEVLSADGMAASQRAAVPIGDSGRAAAMGFEATTLEGVRVLAKTGGTANYYARVILAPDERWGIVILANTFDIGLNSQYEAFANNLLVWLVRGQAPASVSRPLGGGNSPMKFALAAILGVEIIGIFRSRKRLRAEHSSRHRLGRSLALLAGRNALLGAAVLWALPQLLNTPLSFLYYFLPDVFWLALAVVLVPLAWDAVRAVRMLTQNFGSQPVAVAQPM